MLPAKSWSQSGAVSPLLQRHVARQGQTGYAQFKLIANTLQRKLPGARRRASKSIIYVLTEADQKVAGAGIMQIMMPGEQPRNADRDRSGTVEETDAECREAAQLATY